MQGKAILQEKIAPVIRLDHTLRQQLINTQTQKHYIALKPFEQEQILAWLQKNLKDLPILAKTKKTGLAEIRQGQIDSNSALLLIRYALKNLKQITFD